MGCFHSTPTTDSAADGAGGRGAVGRGSNGYDDIAAAGRGPTRSPPSYKFAVEGSGLSVQSRAGSRSSRAAIRVNKSFIGADLSTLMDEQGNVSALVSRQLSMMSHYSVRSESGSVVITPEDADVPGFKLLRLIGRGGFGKVYLAEWSGHGRVAVKVMAGDPAVQDAAEGSDDADWEQRREQMAQMEAILMSVMHHPNIVKTHKVTCSGGVPLVDPDVAAAAAAVTSPSSATAATAGSNAASPPPTTPTAAARRRSNGSNGSTAAALPVTPPFQWHIIMEYCDRGSLSRALAANRLHEAIDNVRVKWDCWASLEILKEVVQALMFLHDNRIVHGDLKAANVLLAHSVMDRRGYEAKVADFGMSRVMAVGRNTIHTQTFGTVTHMPPELLSGGTLTIAADIFSIGVLMWEIYTAERVFPKLSDTEVILAVVTKRVRPPWSLDAPPSYRKLAERCWAEVADARPSLDDVYNELEELQSSMCPRGQASSRPVIYSSAAATARQFRPAVADAGAPAPAVPAAAAAAAGAPIPGSSSPAASSGSGAVAGTAPSPAPSLPAPIPPSAAASTAVPAATTRAVSTPPPLQTFQQLPDGASPAGLQGTQVHGSRGARSPLGLNSRTTPTKPSPDRANEAA